MTDPSQPQSLAALKEKEKEDGDSSRAQTPTSTSATLNNPTDIEAQLANLPSDSTDQHKTYQKNWYEWPGYFNQEIKHDLYLEVQLLILSFTTGFMDALTFAVYSVFVSKQTGNTVFLALAALKHGSVDQTEPNVAVSFFLFLAGAAVFGHTGHILGHKRRVWLLFSNTIQCLLIFAAAALRHWNPSQRNGPFTLEVIALLSFSFGGQVSMALCLKVPDLNTTMVTGAIIQIATDDNLFARDNPSRDRRVMFVLFLLAGAFVGSAAARLVDASVGILLVALLKTFVTGMFLFNGSGASPSREKAMEAK